MSTSDEEPSNAEDEGWADEDGRWWDALFESPLGEIALVTTLCVVGGAVILAWSKLPVLVFIACTAVVILSFLVITRFVVHPRSARTYVLAAAIAIGGLIVAATIAYLVWAILCDC